MTRPPTRKEATHDRIVEVAARAIRRAGYQGVGVADIMKEAGLTHGGFYAHFASRDALLAEAIERAGRDSAASLGRRMATYRAEGASPFRALVESYLTDLHLDSCERGCPVASLASEMPRQAPEVRAASARRVQALLEAVQHVLPADAGPAAAALVTSTLVGALQLARAYGDTAEGRALLARTREALLAQYDHEAPSPGAATTH